MAMKSSSSLAKLAIELGLRFRNETDRRLCAALRQRGFVVNLLFVALEQRTRSGLEPELTNHCKGGLDCESEGFRAGLSQECGQWKEGESGVKVYVFVSGGPGARCLHSERGTTARPRNTTETNLNIKNYIRLW